MYNNGPVFKKFNEDYKHNYYSCYAPILRCPTTEPFFLATDSWYSKTAAHTLPFVLTQIKLLFWTTCERFFSEYLLHVFREVFGSSMCKSC